MFQSGLSENFQLFFTSAALSGEHIWKKRNVVLLWFHKRLNYRRLISGKVATIINKIHRTNTGWYYKYNSPFSSAIQKQLRNLEHSCC